MRSPSVQPRRQQPWCTDLIAAAMLIAAPAPSATPHYGSISGQIRDSAGAPIGSARVTIEGTQFTTIATSAGAYRIERVPVGTVTLLVEFTGYRPMRLTDVAVRKGHTTVQDFVLTQAVMDPRLVERLPVDAIPDVVALQPGIVVRGGRSDETAVYVDGVALSPGSRGGQFIGSNAFEGASVTTGAASAGFGNAAGGVLPITPDWNTEEYHRIGDNRFLAAATNPLSTFSIDVDAASYSNMRRFITGGQAPPPDAVRIEEMINYFDYPYAEPRGQHPFSVTLEEGPCPWQPDHRLVLIGLQARHLATEELPPNNLVFLLDVSGSMQSPDKLPLVKRAFRLLVTQLRPQDRVAIVVYAGAAGQVLPSTPGSDRRTILEAIDRLEAGGSTAGGAGIQLAYSIARQNFLSEGNNRVILATDGDFNVGASSEGELVRMIEQYREGGTFLTVLGFGTGNLKDARMEQLADKGNGNYAYIDNLSEARKVFVHQMGATLFTVAKDVKLQLEFNPARVSQYRLIGYENRMLAKEDFNDDRKDAGELGAGHAVTALYEIVPVGVPYAAAREDSLRYQTVAVTSRGRKSGEWLTLQLRYKQPQETESRLMTTMLQQAEYDEAPSETFRFASAVAEFGLVLRNSEFRGNSSASRVLARAERALGEDLAGYRAEFVELVRRYRELGGGVRREE